MRKVLKSKQQYFQECVDAADVRHLFPRSPLDDVREIDHNTMRVLQCFAELVIDNNIPDEFERLAVCPVCNYKRVTEINEAILVQKLPTAQIADMHPFDDLAIRKHSIHCIPRVTAVVANLVPRDTEVTQAKRVVDKLAELEQEVAELQRGAAGVEKYKEAVDAAKTRADMLIKHGELTGEIERPDAGARGHNQIPLVIALHPTSPTPPSMLPAINAEFVDDTEDD